MTDRVEDMVERVARGLAALEYERDHGRPMPADFTGPDYQWEDWSHDARAAIEAMRESTEAMKRAGEAAQAAVQLRAANWVELEGQQPDIDDIDELGEMFTAMIDAALNPGHPHV